MEGLMLVNSLIEDTDLVEKVVDWKEKHCKIVPLTSTDSTGKLGKMYWKGFMRHHADALKATKG